LRRCSNVEGLPSGLAATLAHGLVGQLGLVAPAHEQPPGTVALTLADGRWQALGEQADCGAELVVTVLSDESLLDEARRSPRR